MKSTIIYYNLIILLLASVTKANLSDFLNFHLKQERIQCIGVRCPAEKPTCVVEDHIAKCVSKAVSSDISGNRLSRPALGLSLSRPPSGGSQQDSSIQSRVPSLCFESPESGLCRAYFRSYYFNPKSGRCENFVYGGCGGNSNRFRYERDCKMTCADPFLKTHGKAIVQISSATTVSPLATSQTSGCHLTPDPGPCSAFIPRFYFNKETQRCESFNYGGCQGNGNNFESFDSCQQVCADRQHITVPVSNNEQQSTTFPSNSVPQMPQLGLLNSGWTPSTSFPGSALYNTIETAQSLLANGFIPDFGLLSNPFTQHSICSLPKKVGPCRARIPRYFFNNDTQTCEQFMYGGCRDNGNNFQTEQECFQSCNSPNVRNRPFPLTQMQPFPFWRDAVNDVAFREFLIRNRMKASGNMMGASTTNYYVCTQPVNQGSCFEKTQSFFFNSQTGNCEPFVFRGCGGNRNRFKTREACQQFCMNTNNQSGNIQ